jgi:hypothetical protein
MQTIVTLFGTLIIRTRRYCNKRELRSGQPRQCSTSRDSLICHGVVKQRGILRSIVWSV